MPETPVLTKKQQKSSLSAKKTKTKETVRNVLAIPYDKYWPLISAEQCELLQDVLSKGLSRILPEKVQVPWKLLAAVPKSDRKKFRQEYLEKQELGLENTHTGSREGLIFGVNDVTKALEKGVVKSLLVTEDVHPKLMVEHLLDLSVLFRIPVLIVPELRSVLKSTCGLSSVALAFTGSTRYEVIQQTIENIHREYPVPKNHINFERAMDVVNSSVIIIEDSAIENPEADANSKRMNSINIDESVICISDIDGNQPFVEQQELRQHDKYLYRQSKGKRIFTPCKNDNMKNNDQQKLDSSGFLSLTVDISEKNKSQLRTDFVDTLEENKKSQKESQEVISFCLDPEPSSPKVYKSLKVKKVKGDVNRNKRKIEEMKQRKQNKNKKLKKGKK